MWSTAWKGAGNIDHAWTAAAGEKRGIEHEAWDTAAPEENLSAGRVESLEQARQRQRRRRIRRTAALVLLLTAVVAFATGLVGAHRWPKPRTWWTASASHCVRMQGRPQNTGIPELFQLEQLSGCFVELGEDACVVYSNTGSRLNFIQSGYARPALAAGRTRFVLYNRSGNELRVESRTQNLYQEPRDTACICAPCPDVAEKVGHSLPERCAMWQSWWSIPPP